MVHILAFSSILFCRSQDRIRIQKHANVKVTLFIETEFGVALYQLLHGPINDCLLNCPMVYMYY
jgi:hypothetical protein